ncbi:MAG: cobalt ECF transporter T component CbiQ [Methanothrix sp.]|jgi:cobalt/nickel transport system permease protein|uniref:cobalt ECF transporter T component CbiQ n=1 Tax=Methanothrix sp. TaxID=90426 RepID=UPI0025E62437|nr:cobalt ECF transporter T component CbiQ [Methanothrix sp.]MBK7385709.1 cobalt ECF transporter T component CbiQ [Methanothrix sp.]HPW73133.1 cobalt ECF transporter T component CbiQ [Methanothrix sp.]
MHDLLDDWAQCNGLRETSARLKLFFGLGAIAICISSLEPAAPLFVAASMSLIILILAKIPPRIYSRLLLFPLSFALISSLVVALMHGSGDMLYALDLFGRVLGIREDGAALALLLIARTFGGMCSLFFIALTTPMIEIFALLSSLRIPKSVIELSMMIYRYIFVLLDQAAMIHNAQVMRLGNRSIRSSLASFSMLASVLFLRSWEQGERLVIAMDARCYDGRLDLMEERRGARAKEIVAAAAYLAMALAISIASSRQGII